MLEIVNLSKSFGKKLIFNDISLTMEPGNIYGFVGVNGIGKSVFFRVISGIIKPSSGKILLDGKLVGRQIDFLDNLGYMDNDANFIKDLTGYQNLELLASIRNKVSAEKLQALMEEYGLDPHSKLKVKHYSLGMYQKLAFIQAIMEDPDILIFDEPFNGLDKKSCAHVKEVIRTFREQNKLIMVTSHILNDIEEIANHVYEFEDFGISAVTKEE